jgi:hypothetical protein
MTQGSDEPFGVTTGAKCDDFEDFVSLGAATKNVAAIRTAKVFTSLSPASADVRVDDWG